MIIPSLHPWDVPPREAVRIQRDLKNKLILKRKAGLVRLVAGCDIALDPVSNTGFGGVIVYSYPDLAEVERKSAFLTLRFPYIPGLLAFREGPVLLEVIASLENAPDVFIFDGQGIAHPRGLGIASHLGLFLDRPTIGCAKSRLYGTYEEPAWPKGSFSPLLDAQGKPCGAVLRTRDHVKPVFVSPGHRMDLKSAVEITLACVDGLRIPKPTREADHFVESLKRRSLVPPPSLTYTKKEAVKDG